MATAPMQLESEQLNERAEELMDAEQWTEAIQLIESQPQLFQSDAQLSWNLGCVQKGAALPW